jgi:hypothetical protein
MFRKLVSVACLAVIFFGCRYAYAREQVRYADPQKTFDETNRLYFNNQLPRTVAHSGYLTEMLGGTYQRYDGSFEIVIDLAANPDMAEYRDTVQHESCHVFVMSSSPDAEDHGDEFKTCMGRYTSK